MILLSHFFSPFKFYYPFFCLVIGQSVYSKEAAKLLQLLAADLQTKFAAVS
jgi:hypothetical protein